LLWTWHSPAINDAIARSPVLELALHCTLFLTALVFWSAVLTISAAARWQTIPVLLLTSKLTCLLAALLIFAPRILCKSASHLGHIEEGLAGLLPLDDQHLAGLLMITACPLSYLLAAVVITVQLIYRPEPPGTILRRRRLPIGQ
jgi:putative membrane protein